MEAAEQSLWAPEPRSGSSQAELLTGQRVRHMPLGAAEPSRLLQYTFYLFVLSLTWDNVLAASGLLDAGRLGLTRITVGALFFMSVLYSGQCYDFRHASSVAMVLFVGVHLASALISESIFDTGAVVVSMRRVVFGLQFVICASLLRYATVRRRAVLVFICGVVVTAVLQLSGVGYVRTIEQYHDVLGVVGERVSAFGSDPNLTGAAYGVALTFATALGIGIVPCSWRWRVAMIGAGALCGAGLVQTGSRGALVATVAGLLPFYHSRARFGKRIVLVLTACIVSAGLAYAVMSSQAFRVRVEASLEAGDTAGRTAIWIEALELFAAKPVMGWNPFDGPRVLGERFGKPVKDTHNAFVGVALSYGIMGLMPFLWIFVSCAATAYRDRGGVHGIAPLAVFTLVVAADLSMPYENAKDHWFAMAYAASGARLLLGRRSASRGPGRAAGVRVGRSFGGNQSNLSGSHGLAGNQMGDGRSVRI